MLHGDLLPLARALGRLLAGIVRNLIQISDLLQGKMDWVTGPTSTEGLRDVQLLGLPEPVLLGLNVPRCLDNVPLGLLLVLLQNCPTP